MALVTINERIQTSNIQGNLERDYPPPQVSQSNTNASHSSCTIGCRQKYMLPSAGRIVKDMKHFENKFYERFLWNGYKFCECSICNKLLLKFMIKEDRDCNEYHDLHKDYLNRKLIKEGIKKVDGVYQNHTIIFVNKAGI